MFLIMIANTTQVIIEAAADSEEIRIPLMPDADAHRVAAELADRFRCRVRVEQVQVYGLTSRQTITTEGRVVTLQEARIDKNKAPCAILCKMRSEPQRAFHVDDLIDPDRGLNKSCVASALYNLWKKYKLIERVSRGKFRACDARDVDITRHPDSPAPQTQQ